MNTKKNIELDQIVVAWLVEGSEVIPGPVRRDMGELHKFRKVLSPRAVMWRRKGSAEDMDKARRFAETEGAAGEHLHAQVFTYPQEERDPIGKAKAAIAKLYP